MPRPRFATADAQLQRRILEAATREFSSKGYEAASLNQILMAAGLSKGSFYYYFDDKADLAAAVLAALLEELKPVMSELGAPRDAKAFWASLQRYIDRTMDESLGTPQRLELVGKLGMAYIDHPELAAQVEPRITGFRQEMVAFFERGQKVGAVRSDLSGAALVSLVQAMKASLASSLLPRRAPTRAELDAFTQLLLGLLRRVLKP